MKLRLQHDWNKNVVATTIDAEMSMILSWFNLNTCNVGIERIVRYKK